MPFTFAQMTDSHLYAPTSEGPREIRDRVFTSFAGECAAHGIDFIIHTGDFVNGDQEVEAHRHFKGLCNGISRDLGIPYYHVRGNHDASLTDDEYQDIYGQGTYWFSHEGWAFLAIDRYYRTYEHTHHAYCMSADTMDRVRNLLQEIPETTPLVVLLHDDPVGISRFHRGQELLLALEHHAVKLLLFGHVQCSYVGGYAGIPFATVTGDDRPHDTSPLSYNIITCSEEGVASCDFHPYTTHTQSRPASPGPLPGGTIRLGTDWPDGQGTNGARGIDNALPDVAPGLVWEARLPGRLGVGAPALKDGALVATTMTRGRVDQCRIQSFDAVTGTSLWATPVDGSVEGGALLHEGRAYCGTSAGSLYCLDAQTGATLWQWNNRDNMPIACRPVLDDGLVHCGANWEMYAVDAEQGETVWRAVATPNGFTYMGPGNASPLVAGNRVYHRRTFNAVDEGCSQIQSVDKRTGKDLQIVRTRPHMHPMHRHASPVLHEGRIYAVANGLLVVDPAQPGEALHWFKHEAGSATPALWGGRAFVSYHDEIVAYDLNDGGRVLWSVPHEPARCHFSGNTGSKWGLGEQPLGAFSAPLAAGDRLLVCDTGGNVRCLEAESGEERWRLTLDAPILAAPILSGNGLFVGDYEGRLYGLAF